MTLLSLVKAVFLGGDTPYSRERHERATRCMIVAFFIAPLLFVTVELSPTAWAVTVAVILFLNNPRLLVTSATLSPLFFTLLVFAGIGALSAIWSVEPARSLSASMKLAGFIILGKIIIDQLMSVSDDQRGRLWRTLVAGCAIGLVCLTAIEIAVWLNGMPSTTAVRTFHKTTFYGLFFAAFLLFSKSEGAKFRLAFVVLF